MKRVVSVSLGTSARDKSAEVEFLGERFTIERRGADGDLDRFASLFRELDGQVDALGIGGCDLYVATRKRTYTFRQIKRLVAGARTTPVVDGSGLKHTLERATIYALRDEGTIDFATTRTLLVSAVDRFGMAQALDEVCPQVIYGDLLFGLGLPIPIRSYRTVERLGTLVLPLVTRLPLTWFYPTGDRQTERRPRFAKVFDQSNLICGDWHYIRRYAPDRLPGKTILTQTLRRDDLTMLSEAGAARAITTTPVIDGESFATNVMEAVLVALLQKRPETLTQDDYLRALDRLGWRPQIIPL